MKFKFFIFNFHLIFQGQLYIVIFKSSTFNNYKYHQHFMGIDIVFISDVYEKLYRETWSIWY